MQENISKKCAVGLDQEMRNIFYMKTLLNCSSDLYVLPNVTFSFPRNITIGHNVFINRGVIVTARSQVSIGDEVAIGPYCVINSGSHNYRDKNKLIRKQGHRSIPISIDRGAWIGAHATILPGVHIGEGAVVGAGAVVVKSVERFTVVAGVPAKVVSTRI